MRVQALFGLSVLMSFVAFAIVAAVFIWPRLRSMRREDAVLPLVAPHMFRFVGLSFLEPGVVAASLPQGFAGPAAYGDLIAAILAVISTLALSSRAPWATAAVWVFNIWGSADLLNAFFEGLIRFPIGPGSLGAAFYIPTVVVPPLLVTHALIFRLLLRPAR